MGCCANERATPRFIFKASLRPMRPFFYFVIPSCARNDNFTRHGSIKTETALNVEVLASMFEDRKKARS
jgi:hypothetical protein